MSASNIYVALIHFPVMNKRGDVIASAVTNLDLHDIARASATFGVKSFFVVTPIEDQKELSARVMAHWIEGFGGEYNPDRKKALSMVRITDSVEETVLEIEKIEGRKPNVIATCARPCDGALSFRELRSRISTGEPYLLMLGTGWGLSPSLIEGASAVLEPISGNTDYNHLSVRAAAAIMLDRLLGAEWYS